VYPELQVHLGLYSYSDIELSFCAGTYKDNLELMSKESMTIFQKIQLKTQRRKQEILGQFNHFFTDKGDSSEEEEIPKSVGNAV
jgi:hypothetical protein